MMEFSNRKNDERTLDARRRHLKDQAYRFKGAMHSLELGRRDFMLEDLLTQETPLEPRLSIAIRHMTKHQRTQEEIIRDLWNATEQPPDRLSPLKRKRLREIRQFCVRASYKLSMQESEKWNGELKKSLNIFQMLYFRVIYVVRI